MDKDELYDLIVNLPYEKELIVREFVIDLIAQSSPEQEPACRGLTS
jgi:hypothetical protein